MTDERAVRANVERFSGFADLYDANRPTAPGRLGPVLAAYAGVDRPTVVDLGSGTGLSTRWAAAWAGAVTGVEPNDDMRAQAQRRALAGVAYAAGTGDATGLPDACADVVTVVQAMHWMEPRATLTEIARILRPGGVLAVLDADWPPVTGIAAAEQAWAAVHRRIRVYEARIARGERGEALARPVDEDDPALRDDDLADTHRNRLLPAGGRSWSKREHLANIRAHGAFGYTRDLAFDAAADGADPPPAGDAAGEVDHGAMADRFVALMRSQGSYQAVRNAGLDDDVMGMTAFETDARRAFATATSPRPLTFCWRVRLGVRS